MSNINGLGWQKYRQKNGKSMSLLLPQFFPFVTIFSAPLIPLSAPSHVRVYKIYIFNIGYILYSISVILFTILVIRTLDDQISESIVNLILVIILAMMAFFYFRILLGVTPRLCS